MINQLILTSLELVAPEVRGSGESSGRCVASAIVSKPMGSYGNGARAMLSGPGVPTGLVGVLTVVLTEYSDCGSYMSSVITTFAQQLL